MADGKITVTLKADKGFDAPWVVLSGDTAAEVRDVIGEVEQSGLLVDVGRVANAFKGYATTGGVLGARPTEAPRENTPNTGQNRPSQETNPGWGSPTGGQPQNAPQNGPQRNADGSFNVTDNYGNEWTYDVPNAPSTPRGPAIVKSGITKSGKHKGETWRKWMDPAAGPQWRENGNQSVPAAERWQGDFLR